LRLCGIEAFHCLHQAKVSFLNQVRQGQAEVDVIECDFDDEARRLASIISIRAAASPSWIRRANVISSAGLRSGTCPISVM
jgi:hypothetical protein